MAGAGAPEVRFEDVMIHFSTEEWAMLEKWQRELYLDVSMENYESLITIGTPVTSSDVILWLERREQENCTESLESRAGNSSADGGHYNKTQEPPMIVDVRFEEEMAQNGSLGETPEDLTMPFMHQGCPWRDECIPHLEKATGEPASPTHSQDAAAASKPYECPWCGDRFRLKGLLRIHHVVSLRKPSLHCPVCAICFPTCWHLKRHEKIHRRAGTDRGRADCLDACHGGACMEGRGHFCAVCGESFRWYLDFLQHQKSHEEAKVWTCAQCDDAFMHQSDLAMHEESHLDEALCASSSPCGMNCVCRDSVLLHLAAQPETSTENSGTGLQGDKKLHQEGKREKPYSCHQCSEQFSSEGNLKKHYQYCCKEQLQKHRHGISPAGQQKEGDGRGRKRLGSKARRNHSRSAAGWACPLCPKSFRSRYSLFKHRQRHQAEERRSPAELDRSMTPTSDRAPVTITKKLHKCQECGEKFAFKRQLVTHMETHAEESCRCAFCGESLGYKDRFGNHLRIHLGEQASGRRQQEDFRVSSAATEPEREEEKELCQCGECGKTLRKSYFPDHKAWHSGIRFMCRFCGTVSNFYSGAHRHLQQHRKRRDFSTCPECGAKSQSKSCFCSIKKFYVGQDPPPPRYNLDEMSRAARDSCGRLLSPASNKRHIPSGTKPGKLGESKKNSPDTHRLAPKPPKASQGCGVQEEVCLQGTSDNTPQDSHGQAAVPAHQMQQGFQPQELPQQALDNTR